MVRDATLAELIAEGDAVPVEGWDFSWFDGRATEERPAWRYSVLIRDRLSTARAALDIQTGGGEVTAGALSSLAQSSLAQSSLAQSSVAQGVASRTPEVVAATDSWPPNIEIARRNLAPFGGTVAQVDDGAPLPFGSGSFDLVISRHPTEVSWPEIARVLAPGGTYLSQQVGAGTNRELYEFMMGPQPDNQSRSTALAVADAEAAGLEVVDLREQATRVEFFDVAAVVYFLRKVLWTVPGFTSAGYSVQLARMHEHIRANGSFVCHSQRFLIEARKPS